MVAKLERLNGWDVSHEIKYSKIETHTMPQGLKNYNVWASMRCHKEKKDAKPEMVQYVARRQTFIGCETQFSSKVLQRSKRSRNIIFKGWGPQNR